MAIILQPRNAERYYLLRALTRFADSLKGDPEQADLREAIHALRLAVVDEEVLVITQRGMIEVAMAVCLYAARDGRCAESEAIIAKLAPLASRVQA